MSSRPEVRVRLPYAPIDVDFLRNDLTEFSCKHKVAASLQLLDVVVGCSSSTSNETLSFLRQELLELLWQYIPELERKQSEKSCKPVDEATALARAEERESLQAIYDHEFEVIGIDEWLVQIADGVVLRVVLPPEYPGAKPPMPSIECPEFTPPAGIIDELLEQCAGDVCVYQWAEHLRSTLDAWADGGELSISATEEALESSSSSTYIEPAARGARGQRRRGHKFSAASGDMKNSVPLHHGDLLVCGKSKFQAHAARIQSKEQAEWVYRNLLEDGKIGSANHNIVAYSFWDRDKQKLVKHTDTDREPGAGNQLAMLLEKNGAKDVFMMVSRWKPPDAPMLGADRHRNTCHVALSLLQDLQLCRPPLKSSSRPQVEEKKDSRKSLIKKSERQTREAKALVSVTVPLGSTHKQPYTTQDKASMPDVGQDVDVIQ
jgi:hypothetical protein